MKKDLIIYGNGHMAKMLYHIIKATYNVVAFTVDDDFIDEKTIEGIPVKAFSNIEATTPPQENLMLIAVGFVNMNEVREQKYIESKAKGYSFINYIHPSVCLYDNIDIGENNIILEFVSIHPYTKIANNNFISGNTNIGHGCSIEDNCWINAGVSIAGESVLKNNCFLGVNSSVGHDVTLSERSFIGANTLIHKDTMPGEVYLSPSGEKFRLKSDAFLKFCKII